MTMEEQTFMNDLEDMRRDRATLRNEISDLKYMVRLREGRFATMTRRIDEGGLDSLLMSASWRGPRGSGGP